MLIFDLVLLLIIIGFIVNGWQNGLIRTLAGLIGIIAGILIANHFYLKLAFFIARYFEGKENLANIVAYLAIFFVVNGAIGVVAYILDRAYHILSFIPFLKTINNIAGSIVGLLSGIIILYGIFYLLAKYPISGLLDKYLQESKLAPVIKGLANQLLPLLYDLIAIIKKWLSQIKL